MQCIEEQDQGSFSIQHQLIIVRTHQERNLTDYQPDGNYLQEAPVIDPPQELAGP